MRLKLLILLLVGLLALPITAQQDEETPAPEFLYRDGDTLVLVNGYTGETRDLTLEVSPEDMFTWSPDGVYLVARLQDDEEPRNFCLNLYEVDTESWLYDEPIACGVNGTQFTPDGTKIFYSINTETSGVLWVHNLVDGTSEEAYNTGEGSETTPRSVSCCNISPTGTYITFRSALQILGGTNNTLVVMNTESLDYIGVAAPNIYYASYRPIWSEDDSQFLIILKEEYVTSGTLPYTNHEGDVYLVDVTTGDRYRLTYTPAITELDVHWTEDGGIAFHTREVTVTITEFDFTVDEAMNVPDVPDEGIVRPDRVEREDIFGEPDHPNANIIISPDPNYGAWIRSPLINEGEQYSELNIGYVLGGQRQAVFSVDTPDLGQYQNRTVIIGWRPSDYDGYGYG